MLSSRLDRRSGSGQLQQRLRRVPHRLVRRGSTAALIAITLVAIIVIVALAYLLRPGRDLDEYRGMQGQLMKQTTGLARPVENKLAAAFTDADNDLVADSPTDAAKLIDPDVLKFSYLAASNASEFQEVFKPWVDFLATTTGKKVQYVPFTSTEELLVALRDGKIHVMAFNTGAVGIAVNAGGFVPVAVLGDEKGQSKSSVKIIASTRKPLASKDLVTALRLQQLVLTDPTSNSGFKAPLVLLSEMGLVPGRDYAIRYSGGHPESIAGIASRSPDGYAFAAVASDVLAREQAAGKIKPDDYEVLFTSDSFPTATFGHVHNLNPELAAKVKQGLLEFNWKDTSVAKFFEGTGQSRVVPVDYKKDFELVRKIDNAIGFEHQIKDIPVDLTATTQPAN